MSPDMEAGRVDVYIHSDSTTPAKGGALVKVLTQTDFSAKDQVVRVFSYNAAKFAYAAQSDNWEEIISFFPEVEEERKRAEYFLKEKIVVAEIKILKLEQKVDLKKSKNFSGFENLSNEEKPFDIHNLFEDD